MFRRKSDKKKFTDEDLMRFLIESDDSDALAELYNRYASKILGYFIKIFKGDVPKSQDLLQDVFVRVMEKKQLFDPNRKFYTWVFTIAANMSKMSFRAELTESVDDVDSDRLIAFDTDLIDRKYVRSQLKDAIYALEYNHRSVFILRYHEGFSLKEIADITESGIGTVKSRLFYATKKLAVQLAEHNTKINQV